MDDLIGIINGIVYAASWITGVFLFIQSFKHIQKTQEIPYILIVSGIVAIAFPVVLAKGLEAMGFSEQAQYASIPAKLK